MTAARHIALLLALILSCATAGLAAPLRVIVISDLNGSYGSVRYDARVPAAVSRIIELKPDLVISTGDMVAGQRRPHLSEDELRAMWRAFHELVTDPLSRAGIPLAVTPGNHDASAYRGFARERRIYAEEWTARRPDLHFLPGSRYPFDYAFDLQKVRLVSMDVTTVGAIDAEQMRWLDRILEGSAETRIVFSHLPLWPFAVGRESEVIGDPRLEQLLVQRDVDVHLSGHHHAFYPGTVAGIALVAQACLGSGSRTLIGDTRRSDPAITVLEISDGGEVAVSALSAPTFSNPVQLGNLPRRIASPMRVIERLDIMPSESVTWRADLERVTH